MRVRDIFIVAAVLLASGFAAADVLAWRSYRRRRARQIRSGKRPTYGARLPRSLEASRSKAAAYLAASASVS